MALSIEEPETERLARNLAEGTGETIATATRRALEERLVRVGPTVRKAPSAEEQAALGRRWPNFAGSGVRCRFSTIALQTRSSVMMNTVRRADGH